MASTTNSHVLFTTLPSPKAQESSELFKQYGINNEIAAPIREIALTPVTRPTAFNGHVITFAICSLVQASLLGFGISADGANVYASILATKSKFKEFVRFPEIVVSFGQDNLKEKIVGLTRSNGFREESSGKRVYYRGMPSMEIVQQLFLTHNNPFLVFVP